jgi:hypothetical protein
MRAAAVEKPAPVVIPDFPPAYAMAPAPPPPERGWAFTFEIGARYWYSSGELAKELFDDPRSSTFLNSRLTYYGLNSHAAEVFARAEHDTGSFLKGYAGLSGLDRGSLNDEDFPPALVPYSSTLSAQRDGDLAYFSMDVGYYFFQGPRGRIGLFAGYHYLHEKVQAFGCTQVATHPFVCVPSIADSILAITEDAKWHSARLGVVADVKLAPRLTLSGEAAVLPYTQIKAFDTHWLRLGTGLFDIAGPIPQLGTGYGVQLEALLSYDVTRNFSLGAGARYWHMRTEGRADFEQVIVGWPFGAVSQPLDFRSERYGVFVQGSYRFGT